MEEGPEPHEVLERTVEHHHHHERADGSHVPPAVAAAVLAVLAAGGALLSGHAANQAILLQTRATDQWSYFQAKSTKGHVYQVSGEMLAALTDGTAARPRVGEALEKFRKQAARYEKEKEELQEEARRLEEESQHEFHKHHYFALGIAVFQIGIVLASISILVRFRTLFYLSVVAGVVGLLFLGTGVTI